YISDITKTCYKRKSLNRMTNSDKIDRIVTNRVLALPIFALIMFIVYALSIGTVGDWTVGFMSDTLFGGIIAPAVQSGLETIGCASWLVSLVVDGIIGGVGSVLSFVPQMMILFLLLSLLEDCGYMSRVAFIMDKLFRKFGLSGKSFIPLLVATGCGVPGIMASRTIELERDRRMTVITTGFIPCGAKMPMVGFISGALFGGSAIIALSAYMLGIAAVVVSGLILKKTKPFGGDPAPFVMELPSYHLPVPSNVLRTTWERGWGFVKRAGTVVLTAGVILWILQNLSFTGGFHYITEENSGTSILEILGGFVAWIFKPLGFGNWQTAVATVLGLLAKEEVVGAFGTMAETGAGQAALGLEIFGGSQLAGFSFMVFNLLCAPCFAAMGAIRREMNSIKWTVGAITYMCVFAYAVSLMVYQIGMLVANGIFGFGTVAAFLVLGVMMFFLLRPNPNLKKVKV
ncbi:MAG: ferrous iron transporter B, partial [Clostridia bacterium]|nr:ferrous iron transporter B [Clostridia bacterium]